MEGTVALTPTRGLLPLLFTGNTAMYAVYLGVGGPLVQTAIANIDPANKVSNAGLVAGVSAILLSARSGTASTT